MMMMVVVVAFLELAVALGCFRSLVLGLVFGLISLCWSMYGC